MQLDVFREMMQGLDDMAAQERRAKAAIEEMLSLLDRMTPAHVEEWREAGRCGMNAAAAITRLLAARGGADVVLVKLRRAMARMQFDSERRDA
ncbi:MAG TPA: hypothetical protein VH253_10975 [Phycisphaerae bacterium]|nr:hypothetical protein [Phycisphaerae bacterium]